VSRRRPDFGYRILGSKAIPQLRKEDGTGVYYIGSTRTINHGLLRDMITDRPGGGQRTKTF